MNSRTRAARRAMHLHAERKKIARFKACMVVVFYEGVTFESLQVKVLCKTLHGMEVCKLMDKTSANDVMFPFKSGQMPNVMFPFKYG